MKRLIFLSAALLCFICQAAVRAESLISVDQRRGVEQTFLTFPEWYLVHSPAEYAAYVAHHPAHDFPFIGHVGQLWSSYRTITAEQIRAGYPANAGYHVMICVIATSTTVEYGLRSIYENTVGRVSLAASSGGLTEEDRYGAAVAQDYVDFIRKEPWYLYDFYSKLKGLWSTTPAFGQGMVRKWERRYALTTEYAIKAVYAKLIELATRSAYEPALMTTRVVVEDVPKAIPANTKIVRELGDGRAIMDLPRYFDFRIAATQLANSGGKLVDIAGNDSVILVSILANDEASFTTTGSRILFEQPMITIPGKKRVALVLPVSELSSFLSRALEQGLAVEHVYDY